MKWLSNIYGGMSLTGYVIRQEIVIARVKVVSFLFTLKQVI